MDKKLLKDDYDSFNEYDAKYKKALKAIQPKLQEIYDCAGCGATTYQERLVNEIREILQRCEVLNDE